MTDQTCEHTKPCSPAMPALLKSRQARRTRVDFETFQAGSLVTVSRDFKCHWFAWLCAWLWCRVEPLGSARLTQVMP